MDTATINNYYELGTPAVQSLQNNVIGRPKSMYDIDRLYLFK